MWCYFWELQGHFTLKKHSYYFIEKPTETLPKVLSEAMAVMLRCSSCFFTSPNSIARSPPSDPLHRKSHAPGKCCRPYLICSLSLSLTSNHFTTFCLLSLNSFHCFEIGIACLLRSLKAKIFAMISYNGTVYLSILRTLHFKLCLVAEKINCTVYLNYALSKKKKCNFSYWVLIFYLYFVV